MHECVLMCFTISARGSYGKIKEYFHFSENIILFVIISMWIKKGGLSDKRLRSGWKIEII